MKDAGQSRSRVADTYLWLQAEKQLPCQENGKEAQIKTKG